MMEAKFEGLYGCGALLRDVVEGAQTSFKGLCKTGELYRKLLVGAVLEEVYFDSDLRNEALEELKEMNMPIPRGVLKEKNRHSISNRYRNDALKVNSILSTIVNKPEILSDLQKDELALRDSVFVIGTVSENDVYPQYPLYDYLKDKYGSLNIKLNIQEDN